MFEFRVVQADSFQCHCTPGNYADDCPKHGSGVLIVGGETPGLRPVDKDGNDDANGDFYYTSDVHAKVSTLEKELNEAKAEKARTHELGGLEHWQFAYRNGTPIVPVGHCCHPVELVKRGFVDGAGWPKATPEDELMARISISRWPDGSHYYARLDGESVVDSSGREKWGTHTATHSMQRKPSLGHETPPHPLATPHNSI